MCVLSIKVPLRKKSGNLFNDPCIYIYIYIYFICWDTFVYTFQYSFYVCVKCFYMCKWAAFSFHLLSFNVSLYILRLVLNLADKGRDLIFSLLPTHPSHGKIHFLDKRICREPCLQSWLAHVLKRQTSWKKIRNKSLSCANRVSHCHLTLE